MKLKTYHKMVVNKIVLQHKSILLFQIEYRQVCGKRKSHDNK